MFKRYFRAATVLALAACSLLVSSCDEEEAVETALLSYGPSGVLHGQDITFIGTGLDKVTSIVFPVNVEVDKSAFKLHTADAIVVTVPIETMEGKVILRTTEGDIETKTNFGLTYEIVIEELPAGAKPGTNATFKGQFLNYVKEVTFFDGLSVTEFVSQSRTELVVAVPVVAKTGPILFSDGKEFAQIVEEVLTVTLPAVTDISPLNVKHAAQLTLTGTDLDLVTEISFPGGGKVSKANFSAQSATQLIVSVPVTATNGKLVLTVASEEEVETEQSIVIILPVVTALSPSDTPLHTAGTTLTLTGTDLDLVAELKFPGVSAKVAPLSKTPTQLEVVIPDGVEGGTLVVFTIHGFSVPVSLPFGNQLVLAKVIYDESVRSPFGPGGGWGGVTTDASSTENPRVGTKSIKVTYPGGWGGGCQFGTWGSSPLSTDGTTYYSFSIYGGPGTQGKEINVNVSGQQVSVVVEEGKWKDVNIPLTTVGSPASISEVWFQDKGWGGTVFIDHIGLK